MKLGGLVCYSSGHVMTDVASRKTRSFPGLKGRPFKYASEHMPPFPLVLVLLVFISFFELLFYFLRNVAVLYESLGSAGGEQEKGLITQPL